MEDWDSGNAVSVHTSQSERDYQRRGQWDGDGIDDGWLAARARDAWACFFSEVPRKWILSEPSGPFGSTGANGKSRWASGRKTAQDVA